MIARFFLGRSFFLQGSFNNDLSFFKETKANLPKNETKDLLTDGQQSSPKKN